MNHAAFNYVRTFRQRYCLTEDELAFLVCHSSHARISRIELGRAVPNLSVALAQRGVRVRVLTNSLAATDASVVHAGYGMRRRDLLAAGVQLYELKPTAMREQGAGSAAPRAGSALRKRVVDSATRLGDVAAERYAQATARVTVAVDELISRGEEARDAADPKNVKSGV